MSYLQSPGIIEEFWSYSGSLTTPGCDSGVQWTVSKQIQPITSDQLKKFQALLKANIETKLSPSGGNNRAV